MEYSKEEIILKVRESLIEPECLYSLSFVNYIGKTEGERYTEITSEELLKEDNYNKLINMNVITRDNSYYIEKLNDREKPKGTNRDEEWIAIEMFQDNKTFPFIGTIVDYQVPLKNTIKDKIGKIDMISYDKETNIMYILELKRPGSNESLLRCILEAYTYWNVVDESKLLKDYNKHYTKFDISVTSELRKAVLIYKESQAYKDYDSTENRYVRELMNRLGVDLFVINESDVIVKKVICNENKNT